MYADPPYLTRHYNVQMRMEEADAIEYQKVCVQTKNPGFVYQSDTDALDDFMTVRWAYKET